MLQVDTTSETSSVEKHRCGGAQAAVVVVLDDGARGGLGVANCRGRNAGVEGKCEEAATTTRDDLRNYPYKGKGSFFSYISSFQ